MSNKKQLFVSNYWKLSTNHYKNNSRILRKKIKIATWLNNMIYRKMNLLLKNKIYIYNRLKLVNTIKKIMIWIIS